MEKLLFGMNDKDKIDLILKASEKGIDIEKDLVPALNNVRQRIKDSLFLKNLKFMKIGEDDDQ